MRFVVIAALATLAACGETTTQEAPAPETPAPAAASTAWDRDLLALMPAIDACIARSTDTRQVSYAGEEDAGVTLVRLQGDERAVDCRVSAPYAGDVTVVQLAPRDTNIVIVGEGDAIFVRGPGENPGGECYQAPEVHDANGAMVGWMIDPQGC